jgi:hypothetical protein
VTVNYNVPSGQNPTVAIDQANSQNMTGTQLTRPLAGTFCFANLPFTPHNAIVTPDYSGSPDVGGTTFTDQYVSAQVLITSSGQSVDCKTGPTVEVDTIDPTYDPIAKKPYGYTTYPFYITFTN